MMNRQELADLIFPEAKDISYYEEKYPERDLPEGAVGNQICSQSHRVCAYRRAGAVYCGDGPGEADGREADPAD